jgi:hypothetical protein
MFNTTRRHEARIDVLERKLDRLDYEYRGLLDRFLILKKDFDEIYKILYAIVEVVPSVPQTYKLKRGKR